MIRRDGYLKRARNWLLFLLVILVWGFNWSVTKGAFSYVVPLNACLQKFMLSALALSLLLIAVRAKIPRDRRTVLKLLLLGFVTAVGNASTYMGLAHVSSSGVGAILAYTQPLFVFCLSVVFLRAEAKVSRLLGAFVGFFGVVMLSVGESSSLGTFAFSEFLLIIGSLLWAVTVVYYKKTLTYVDPVLTNAVQQGVGVVLLVPLVSRLEGFYFSFAPLYILMILYSGIIATAIAATFWLYLVREEDVTVLSSSSFLVPVVAVFVGWMLLGEKLEPGSLIGIGLVLAGTYLVNRS